MYFAHCRVQGLADGGFSTLSHKRCFIHCEEAKGGGGVTKSHTSACTTHCGSKCKGRCKMMSRHFHMAMRNGSNGRLRMKNMRGAFGPTPRSRTPQVTANEDGCAAGWIFTLVFVWGVAAFSCFNPLCLLAFTLEPCASSSRSWHHGFIHQRVRISRSFASILVRPSACMRCVGIQCTCFGDMACCTERIDTIDCFSEVLGFSATRQSYRLLASVACFIGISILAFCAGMPKNNSVR